MANTGWTWDQALDNLTVPRWLALRDCWRRHPPAHWLIASLIGYRPKDAPAQARAPSVVELQQALGIA